MGYESLRRVWSNGSGNGGSIKRRMCAASKTSGVVGLKCNVNESAKRKRSGDYSPIVKKELLAVK